MENSIWNAESMDQHNNALSDRSGPGRPLSKLPMPRAIASTDNLRLSARQPSYSTGDVTKKKTHLPQPLVKPLGENLNASSRYHYGFSERQPRSSSPVRDALRAQVVALDTTSSNTNGTIPEHVDENESAASSVSRENGRCPRQVSPMPSQSLRRPESESTTPFRPVERQSPTKDMTVSPGEIYTPPKAFVKGRRPTMAASRRTVSMATNAHTHEASLSSATKRPSQTARAKSTSAGKSITSSTSLSSIFTDPTSPTEAGSKSLSHSAGSQTGLLKPRLRGENTLASATPPKATANSKRRLAVPSNAAVNVTAPAEARNASKSSAALRDTISKARAAKKARDSTDAVVNAPLSSTGWPSSLDDEAFLTSNSMDILQRRMQQAVTSGHLNIAALNLKYIPPKVMKMYESVNSNANWAEMVDLTRLVAADNELADLEDAMFPDVAASDAMADEEVFFQFGGLEALDMHRNALIHLPMGLRRLERLSILNLTSNKLSNDALQVISLIPALRELHLGANMLEGDLDFGTFASDELQILDVHDNKIKTVSGFAKFVNLRTLSMAGNRIASVQWADIPTATLVELNIARNDFKDFLFSEAVQLSELRTLDASYNALEKLAVTETFSAPKLRNLHLNGNKLQDLAVLCASLQLKVLEVADNKVEEIPAKLAQLTELQTLDLANNNVRLIPADLAKLEALTTLNLTGNPLREKKYLRLSTEAFKAELEEALEASQLSQSNSASQPSSTSHLIYQPSNGILNLSSYNLSTIDISQIDLDLPIHTLKFSNNDLATLPLELLNHPSVKYTLISMDLSHNPRLHPTEYLQEEVFLPVLKSLYIVSTGLISLDALTTHLRAPELKELNISCHRLTGHVPWVRAWYPKCTTLLATDNWFSSVDVEGMRGLEVLDVRNNEIEALPPKLGLLGNFDAKEQKIEGRLRVLEVSGNKFRVPRVTIIEKGTEAVLKDLRRMIRVEEVPEEWREYI
jgi:Leucine-rich repeat (LRR) protein